MILVTDKHNRVFVPIKRLMEHHTYLHQINDQYFLLRRSPLRLELIPGER